MRVSCRCVGRASSRSDPAEPILLPSSVTDAAGGRGLSELHSLGSLGGPEFLVDVLDVGFHGGTADAELGADRGERSIGGQEGQDAGLGRRQGNRLSGRCLAGRIRLIGNSAVTVRRGRSIRHRPKWLILATKPVARVDPVSSDLPGEAPWAFVGGTITVVSDVGGDPSVDFEQELAAALSATDASPLPSGGPRRDRAPALHGRKTCPPHRGFPDGFYVVFADATPHQAQIASESSVFRAPRSGIS